jgi:hypothetical protein
MTLRVPLCTDRSVDLHSHKVLLSQHPMCHQKHVSEVLALPFKSCGRLGSRYAMGRSIS